MKLTTKARKKFRIRNFSRTSQTQSIKVLISREGKETQRGHIFNIKFKLLIVKVSIKYKNDKKNSDDYSGTDDVLKEVLDYYISIGKKYDIACCIYPVNPFISKDKLTEGFEKLIKNNFDCVFSAVKYSYPIQRSFRLDNEAKMIMNEPENYLKRSQDLQETYHDAGQFYWFKIKSFIKENFSFDLTLIVKFSPPIQKPFQPKDFKIKVLFSIPSPGPNSAK